MERMDSLVGTLKDLINFRKQQSDEEVIKYIDKAIEAVVQRMSHVGSTPLSIPSTDPEKSHPYFGCLRGPGDRPPWAQTTWCSCKTPEWQWVRATTPEEVVAGRGSDYDDKVSD